MSNGNRPCAKIKEKYVGVELKHLSYISKEIRDRDKEIMEDVRNQKLSWYLNFTG